LEYALLLWSAVYGQEVFLLLPFNIKMSIDLDTYRKKVWEYIKLEYNETTERFNETAMIAHQNYVSVLRSSIDQCIEEHYRINDSLGNVASIITKVYLIDFIENRGYSIG